MLYALWFFGLNGNVYVCKQITSVLIRVFHSVFYIGKS